MARTVRQLADDDPILDGSWTAILGDESSVRVLLAPGTGPEVRSRWLESVAGAGISQQVTFGTSSGLSYGP